MTFFFSNVTTIIIVLDTTQLNHRYYDQYIDNISDISIIIIDPPYLGAAFLVL